MICLDTNYLIRGLVSGSVEAGRLIEWARRGETLVAPAVVWYEFLCGPVSPVQVETMRAFLHDVVAFDRTQAVEAARLFNMMGRPRRLRVDVLIASAAIVLGASLATDNQADFSGFVVHGLKLLE